MTNEEKEWLEENNLEKSNYSVKEVIEIMKPWGTKYYNIGSEEGYTEGYDDGYSEGHDNGCSDG